MQRIGQYLDTESRKAVTVGALSGVTSSLITSMLAALLSMSALVVGTSTSPIEYFFPTVSGAQIGLPAALLLAAGVVIAFGLLGCIAGSAGGVLFQEFYHSLPGDRTTRKAASLFLALWFVFALIPKVMASPTTSMTDVVAPLTLCLGYILAYSYLLGIHWNSYTVEDQA